MFDDANITYSKGIEVSLKEKKTATSVEAFVEIVDNEQTGICEWLRSEQFVKPYADVDIKENDDVYRALFGIVPRDNTSSKAYVKNQSIQVVMEQLQNVFDGKEIVYNDDSRFLDAASSAEKKYKFSFHSLCRACELSTIEDLCYDT